MLRKYEIELRRLKTELDKKSTQQVNNGNNGNGEHVIKLEREKRRAEEDKNAAITALEMRSREYL